MIFYYYFIIYYYYTVLLLHYIKIIALLMFQFDSSPIFEERHCLFRKRLLKFLI
jgi:hypothetical protein